MGDCLVPAGLCRCRGIPGRLDNHIQYLNFLLSPSIINPPPPPPNTPSTVSLPVWSLFSGSASTLTGLKPSAPCQTCRALLRRAGRHLLLAGPDDWPCNPRFHHWAHRGEAGYRGLLVHVHRPPAAVLADTELLRISRLRRLLGLLPVSPLPSYDWATGPLC